MPTAAFGLTIRRGLLAIAYEVIEKAISFAAVHESVRVKAGHYGRQGITDLKANSKNAASA
jgi:hypothetical protein